MHIGLRSPISVAGRSVDRIELRPPGRRVFESMRLSRGPVRFSETAVIKFAARLGEHTEGTLRRLAPSDLDTVAQAVEELYAVARRRFAARTALTQTAKAEQRRQAEAADD